MKKISKIIRFSVLIIFAGLSLPTIHAEKAFWFDTFTYNYVDCAYLNSLYNQYLAKQQEIDALIKVAEQLNIEWGETTTTEARIKKRDEINEIYRQIEVLQNERAALLARFRNFRDSMKDSNSCSIVEK